MAAWGSMLRQATHSRSGIARRARCCRWSSCHIPWTPPEDSPCCTLPKASEFLTRGAGKALIGFRSPMPGTRNDAAAAFSQHPMGQGLAFPQVALVSWRPCSRTVDAEPSGLPLTELGWLRNPEGGRGLDGTAPEGRDPLPLPTLARRLTSALLGGRRKAVDKLLRGLPGALEQWRHDWVLPRVPAQEQALAQGSERGSAGGAEGERAGQGSEAHCHQRLLKLLNAMLNGCAMAGNIEVGADFHLMRCKELLVSAQTQQGHWHGLQN